MKTRPLNSNALRIVAFIFPFVSAHLVVSSIQSAEEIKLYTAGGLSYGVKPPWEEMAVSSPMRQAQFQVPRAEDDPEAGELAVFYFGPGQGGDLEANIKRWAGQFKVEARVGEAPDRMPPPSEVIPQVTKDTVNGLEITRVSCEGMYLGGMPMQVVAPKSNFALRVAIVHGPEGNVFFKLVGPRKTVEMALASFDALIQSIKA